jgi:hypothetical protein
MATLSKNWLTEKHIDFEYKKYILLAYLSEVSKEFDSNKLYPWLAELVEHYRQIAAIKENKTNILNSFPKRLSQLDFEKFKVRYEMIIEDDALMDEISQIIDFSIPKFQSHLKEGKKIYDFIEEQLHIFPVGVLPLYGNEGYLMLCDAHNKETYVYEYHITLFEEPEGKFRGINTNYITSYTRSLKNSYESIKTDLVRSFKNLPNPATYAVETELNLPFQETLLPIAKRALVKHLASRETSV